MHRRLLQRPRRAPLAATLAALAAPLLTAGAAWAHYCRFKQPDERNLCLAQRESSSYFCTYIKALDTRAFCYAWLNGNPGRCAAIAAPELKARCEAESKARGEELRRAAEAARPPQPEVARAPARPPQPPPPPPPSPSPRAPARPRRP